MSRTTYTTNRIPVAAYLLAMGAPFPAFELHGKGRYDFIFPDEEGGIEWTAGEFDIEDPNAAMVSAPKYFNALRKIRSAINEASGAKNPKESKHNARY